MSNFSASKNVLQTVSMLFFVVLGLFAQSAMAAESSTAEAQTAKPKVIEFYASWAEPCRRLQPIMDHAKVEYSKEIDFIAVNVDDPANRELVEQYGVCPIPTVIFQDANNNIKAYSVGCSEDRNIQSGINKILPVHTTAMAN